MSSLDDHIRVILGRRAEEMLENWESITRPDLPYNITSYGIIYNKSIFDYFQIDTPLDGMTWDEVVELSKKVTGEVNGNEVYGFHLGDYSVLATQWSTDLYNPYTLETTVNTPAWKAIANVLQGL